MMLTTGNDYVHNIDRNTVFLRSFKKKWGNQKKTFGCTDKFSQSNHQNLRFAEHGLKQTLIFWNLIQYK